MFVAWAGTTARAHVVGARPAGRARSPPQSSTGLADRRVPGFGAAGDEDQVPVALRLQGAENKVNDWLEAQCASGQFPDLFTPDGFATAQMIVTRWSQGDGTDVDKMIAALEGWTVPRAEGQPGIRPQDHAMLQPMFRVPARRERVRPPKLLEHGVAGETPRR